MFAHRLEWWAWNDGRFCGAGQRLLRLWGLVVRYLAKGEIPANHLGLRERLVEWADLLDGLDGEFVCSARAGGA